MRRGPYDRLMTWPVLRTVLGVLVLVQAISFAEAFTGNLETMLRIGGRITDFLALQLYEMPATLPLALPAAIGVAVYTALARARSEGLLIVLASAGVQPWRLVGFAVAIGAAAAALSIVVTSEVLPRFKLAERALLHEVTTLARIDALDSAEVGLVIRDLPGLTLIFGADDRLALAGSAEVLVLNHDAWLWNYAQADAARAEQNGPDGTIALQLIGAQAYTLPGETRYGQYDVEQITLSFPSTDYLPSFDATLRADEIPRLSCQWSTALTCPPGVLGGIIQGALLSVVASLCALLAAAHPRVAFLPGSGLLLGLAAPVAANVAAQSGAALVPGGAAAILGAVALCALLLSKLSMARLTRPMR